MAHRSRSRTADSTETKKSKGTPRRLMEKIAIMKRREHEQSEAFERAMKSIFEMQRAQIHSGGGSMPSLQAIDSLQPPSIDMQSVYKDFNEMKRKGTGSFKERPHSGGPGGRRQGFEKRTNSCDTDPYPTIGLAQQPADHYWNTSADWIEGDLSRHKSDSDLQQSLLMQAPLLQFPHPFGSPQNQFRNHKFNPPPGELGLWASKARPSLMSAALLSPDQCMGSSPDGSLPVPLGSAGGASSLPDLTNIEFSSGLDVPLEQDEPDPTALMNPYHQSPSGPGPSQLAYSSYQAPPQQQYNPNMVFQASSNLPPSFGFAPPEMLNSGVPTSHFGYNWGQMPPIQNHQQLPSFSVGGAGGIRKSPTMPDFRTLQSSPGLAPENSFQRPPRPQLSNRIPQFKPILPSPPISSPGSIPTMNNTRLPPYRPPISTVPSQLSHPLGPTTPPAISQFSQPVLSVPNTPTSASVPSTPPLMTIIIQPPVSTMSSPKSPDIIISPTPPLQPQAPSPLTQSQTEPPQKPQPLLNSHEPFTSSFKTNSSTRPAHVTAPLTVSSSPPRHIPSFWTGGASLPNTPTITVGPALPSYIEARQQQALQQKFASFTFAKTEPLFRSHSEENLQKGQKDKENLTHNPFMGNLANASSVPCVYVESPNMDIPSERSDSPTPGDSPSTSASYASSPPSVRPYWVEHPTTMHEFVFHEWPLEGAGERNKVGSPLTKSLTDLTTVPDVSEFSPNSRNRAFLHQISLPSVAIGDLAVEEPLEKQTNSTFMNTDFSMEEDVMDSLLKEEVPNLNAFDVGLLGSDNLMSSSPEGYLRNQY